MAKRREGLPKGVHVVRRDQVGGGSLFHCYLWRGGPKFWESPNYHVQKDAGFYTAHVKAMGLCNEQRISVYSDSTDWLISQFRTSLAFKGLSSRSQSDYGDWLDEFSKEFGEEPFLMFAEWESRAEVQEWRRQWLHSPKQYDYAGTVITLFLNWAVDEEGILPLHYCHRFRKYYKAERNEIIWTRIDIELFCSVAPVWVQDILIAGTETGLRPSDLVSLSSDDVDDRDPTRLKLLTAKRDKWVYIPITPALAELFGKIPQGRKYLLAAEKGGELSARWASNKITEWRRIAGVSKSEDGREKTLNDTRGTAATRLLHAGLTLNEIASYMGWSLRYAANVIEHYAEVSPAESKAVLEKLRIALEKETQ